MPTQIYFVSVDTLYCTLNILINNILNLNKTKNHCNIQYKNNNYNNVLAPRQVLLPEVHKDTRQHTRTHDGTLGHTTKHEDRRQHISILILDYQTFLTGNIF